MNTEGRKSKKRIEINFPETEFTVEDLYEFNQKQCSKVSIQNRINEALLAEKIKNTGITRVNKAGRPRKKFILVK